MRCVCCVAARTFRACGRTSSSTSTRRCNSSARSRRAQSGATTISASQAAETNWPGRHAYTHTHTHTYTHTPPLSSSPRSLRSPHPSPPLSLVLCRGFGSSLSLSILCAPSAVAVQCSAVQWSAVEYSAVQYSTVQCSAVLCSAVLWQCISEPSLTHSLACCACLYVFRCQCGRRPGPPADRVGLGPRADCSSREGLLTGRLPSRLLALRRGAAHHVRHRTYPILEDGRHLHRTQTTGTCTHAHTHSSGHVHARAHAQLQARARTRIHTQTSTRTPRRNRSPVDGSVCCTLCTESCARCLTSARVYMCLCTRMCVYVHARIICMYVYIYMYI